MESINRTQLINERVRQALMPEDFTFRCKFSENFTPCHSVYEFTTPLFCMFSPTIKMDPRCITERDVPLFETATVESKSKVGTVRGPARIIIQVSQKATPNFSIGENSGSSQVIRDLCSGVSFHNI